MHNVNDFFCQSSFKENWRPFYIRKKEGDLGLVGKIGWMNAEYKAEYKCGWVQGLCYGNVLRFMGQIVQNMLYTCVVIKPVIWENKYFPEEATAWLL